MSASHLRSLDGRSPGREESSPGGFYAGVSGAYHVLKDGAKFSTWLLLGWLLDRLDEPIVARLFLVAEPGEVWLQYNRLLLPPTDPMVVST